MRSAATKILGPLTAIMLAAAPFWASGCKTVETMDTTAKPVKEAVSAFMSLGPPARAKTDYQLPARVLLCGEALPMDRPSVREKLEFEFIMAINHPAQVELWRRRAKRYFPLIEKKLREAGLPDDLKYLAVAESDLRPAVSSPAGAKGLWQFMPATARRFGVPVDKKQDQRGLPEPLLTAGMRYLSALRDRFGSWPLAMAAYNAGEARIGGAINSQGTRDYFELDLVNETSRYVYRIAAIKVILGGASGYGFNNQPSQGLYSPYEFDEVSLSFKRPISWAALAKERHCDYKTLRLLNPHLASHSSLSGGPWKVRLPKNRTKTLGT